MTETEKTYDKRLGMLNTQLVEPVVIVGELAWMTRGGKVAVFPDSLEERGVPLLAPLPEGDYEVSYV